MRRIIFIFLTFMLFLSCNNYNKSKIAKGSVNAQNQLIIHIFRQIGSGNEFSVVLKREYGIMIFNTGDEYNPIAIYELSKQKEKQIIKFKNYDSLLEELSKLPKGSTIDIYDKCTVPTFNGLRDFDENDLRNYCQQLGLDISEHRMITCTCPE